MTAVAQELDKDAMKINFMEGESWLLFEEYADALPYYLSLLETYPDNDNYNYRVGICYLNIPGEKASAVSYLEKAVQNINPKYREGSLKEEQAPPDAYFYLGRAYRVNNQLDKAIEAFREFKKILNPNVYNEEVVDKQIEACEYAKKLQNEPLYVDYENLGDPINSRFSDFSPVVSGDESTIVFTRALAFYDALMYSKKVDGKWTEPMNMTEMLGVDVDEKCFSTSLSNDGTVLYLYKNDEYDGNIYVTRLRDGIWSPVEKLNDYINTKYWESHACISRDGNTLYFTSNRKGTYGYLDIYKSERDSTGDWGPAVNLGPKINTPYNEESPFISDNEKTLYFSSYGHLNMGGYDIFYSTLLENGEWSAPLNIGYPINTTDDDLFFVPVQNGIYGYYARYSDQGLGDQDIYRYEIYSDEHPRKFYVHGVVPFDKIKGPYGLYTILVINAKGDTIQIIKPDPETGEYKFNVIAGNYKIVFENEGYNTVTKEIAFTKDQPASELNLTTLQLTLTDRVAEMSLEDTTYSVTSNDQITIDLALEPGSKLTVESFVNEVLLKKEEFDIAEEKFSYSYTPSEGVNLLQFSLTDKFGNQKSRKIVVDYHPVAKPEMIIAETGPTVEVKDTIAEEMIHDATGILNRYATDDLNNTLTQLRNLATGDLKTVLDSLNLEEENITTPRELLDYLLEISSDRDYSDADLYALVNEYGNQEKEKITDLHHNLQKYATGNLKKMLDGLDLEKEGIFTSDQLFDYLSLHAEDSDYSEEDLMALVVALAINGNMDLERFYGLLSEIASGNLSRLLEELDMEEQNINTIEELIAYLYERAGQYGLKESDIMALFLDLAAAEIDEAAITRYLDLQEQEKTGKGFPGWIFWIAIPAGLILIWLILWSRRKNKK